MLGMLGHTFVSFVDNIMVGQLGTAELAAVSLGNSFMFIAMSIGIGFSTAITPLIAEADASNNFKQAKSTYKHGLFMHHFRHSTFFIGFLFETTNVFNATARRSSSIGNSVFKFSCIFFNTIGYF